MHDSGKHSALRQTDDGTFELVVESELDDISNTDPSLDPVVAPAAPSRLPSKRIAILGAVAGLVGLLTIIVALVGSSPDTKPSSDIDDVVGFRPYTGNPSTDTPAAPDKAAGEKTRPTPPKAVADALNKLDDEYPPDLPHVAQPTQEPTEGEVRGREITESETGWELSEEEALAAENPDQIIDVQPVAVEDIGEEFVEEELPLEELPPEEEPLEEEPLEGEPLEGDRPAENQILPRLQSRESLQIMRTQRLGRDAPDLERVRPERLRGLPGRPSLSVRGRLAPDRETATLEDE